METALHSTRHNLSYHTNKWRCVDCGFCSGTTTLLQNLHRRPVCRILLDPTRLELGSQDDQPARVITNVIVGKKILDTSHCIVYYRGIYFASSADTTHIVDLCDCRRNVAYTVLQPAAIICIAYSSPPPNLHTTLGRASDGRMMTIPAKTTKHGQPI